MQTRDGLNVKKTNDNKKIYILYFLVSENTEYI